MVQLLNMISISLSLKSLSQGHLIVALDRGSQAKACGHEAASRNARNVHSIMTGRTITATQLSAEEAPSHTYTMM
jgi:hypothetical protein